MSATVQSIPTQVIPEVRPITISVRELLPWAAFAAFLGLFLLYMVGMEQGATSLFGGTLLHEWVHDARHLLGFPCH